MEDESAGSNRGNKSLIQIPKDIQAAVDGDDGRVVLGSQCSSVLVKGRTLNLLPQHLAYHTAREAIHSDSDDYANISTDAEPKSPVDDVQYPPSTNQHENPTSAASEEVQRTGKKPAHTSRGGNNSTRDRKPRFDPKIYNDSPGSNKKPPAGKKAESTPYFRWSNNSSLHRKPGFDPSILGTQWEPQASNISAYNTSLHKAAPPNKFGAQPTRPQNRNIFTNKSLNLDASNEPRSPKDTLYAEGSSRKPRFYHASGGEKTYFSSDALKPSIVGGQPQAKRSSHARDEAVPSSRKRASSENEFAYYPETNLFPPPPSPIYVDPSLYAGTRPYNPADYGPTNGPTLPLPPQDPRPLFTRTPPPLREESLPDGWIARFDPESDQYYYKHLSTGILQWEFPTGRDPIYQTWMTIETPTPPRRSPSAFKPALKEPQQDDNSYERRVDKGDFPRGVSGRSFKSATNARDKYGSSMAGAGLAALLGDLADGLRA